jgi:hypothetical protein
VALRRCCPNNVVSLGRSAHQDRASPLLDDDSLRQRDGVGVQLDHTAVWPTSCAHTRGRRRRPAFVNTDSMKTPPDRPIRTGHAALLQRAGQLACDDDLSGFNRDPCGDSGPSGARGTRSPLTAYQPGQRRQSDRKDDRSGLAMPVDPGRREDLGGAGRWVSMHRC